MTKKKKKKNTLTHGSDGTTVAMGNQSTKTLVFSE